VTADQCRTEDAVMKALRKEQALEIVRGINQRERQLAHLKMAE
jgi:hypothetical protein